MQGPAAAISPQEREKKRTEQTPEKNVSPEYFKIWWKHFPLDAFSRPGDPPQRRR